MQQDEQRTNFFLKLFDLTMDPMTVWIIKHYLLYYETKLSIGIDFRMNYILAIDMFMHLTERPEANFDSDYWLSVASK